MKFKDYLLELSLVILGVLIALLIESQREHIRDKSTVRSYLGIIEEDLHFDVVNLTNQLKTDSAYAKNLKRLSDVLTTNDDLPQLRYGLSSWTEQDTVPYVKLSTWDSLDYYTLEMYSNTEYATRKIGFSTLVNSNLGHLLDGELLKKITIYYTTDSEYLDFMVGIDDKCQWNAIPFLNQYQGRFHQVILSNEFNATLLKNEASGRYSTTLNEMRVKRLIIEKANALLKEIESYY
jgi:hypothetical protein